MKRLSILVSAMLVITNARAEQLTVLAASSLTDAMKEIAPLYQKETGNEMRLSFGASSMLERQIEEGAPADVFLSADELKMDTLEKAGVLVPGTRHPLLGNTLVIVIPSDSQLQIHSAADLANNNEIKKIAISQPSAVPVGVYSKEYLSKLGLWEKVESKVVPTENVRASLAAVESGNVQAGFVYKTDMLISDKVKSALEIPAREGPKISYPVAALKGTRDLEAAKKLVDYLRSEAALNIFKKYGFKVAE
ncbi:MAG TPA: molybdate ABC transporter substrate-binding protein [Chthoniobacterales bacterium]|jgi:molybdate transport system substrate-binding protein